MKKFLLSLFVISIYFLSINLAYCEEDFFIDTTFKEAKTKTQIGDKTQERISSIKESSKKKFGFFKKKKDDSGKRTRFNYATNQEEEIPRGYWGTLPNIEQDFTYKQQSSKTSPDINAKIPDEKDFEDKNLKPAPYDDALFLDVIVKKEKTSNYVNDVQKTKFALQNLKDCIENQGDLQRFNGCVNLIDLYVKNLKTKYENSSDSLKESYMDILTTNYHAKVLGNLKYDANYYSRYIPTQQGKYSDDNIKSEEQKLLNRINKTIFLINQES